MVAGLEAAVEVHQKRVSGRVDHLEDPLLAHEAVEAQNEFPTALEWFIDVLAGIAEL